jgi:hypothetical protein
MRWLSLLLLLSGGLAFVSGCATTDAESDLPWNMSQPWESAPSLPFNSPGGY